MGNHFHLLVQMIPDKHFTDKEVKKRFEKMYGNEINKPFHDILIRNTKEGVYANRMGRKMCNKSQP